MSLNFDTSVDAAESSTTPLKKLRSHALMPVNPGDVRQALRAESPLDTDTLWHDVCVAAGVTSTTDRLSIDELCRVADVLTRQDGRVSLIGRALRVRLAVYRELDLRGTDAPAPDFDWGQAATEILLRGRVSLQTRIEELISLAPFAPEARPRLDQAATSIARRLDGSLGAVTIVLDDALCVVGNNPGSGTWMTEAGGTPIEWSFCATPVRTAKPYIVNDLTHHVLHRLNPTVLHDGIRAYAGAPLITSAGEVLGACCVLDTRPRNFTDHDVAVLVEEAANVVTDLENHRIARAKDNAAHRPA